jgi:hypothetical protein
MYNGIDIDGEEVSILLYADNGVLLVESDEDLQTLLNALYSWCLHNQMSVNGDKSNVVHLHPTSVERTGYVFKCGDDILQVATSYRYLGLLLTEHLDYTICRIQLDVPSVSSLLNKSHWTACHMELITNCMAILITMRQFGVTDSLHI